MGDNKQRGNPKFEIRVSPERRETWQRAADLEKRSLSDFVRIATDEKTRQVLEPYFELRHGQPKVIKEYKNHNGEVTQRIICKEEKDYRMEILVVTSYKTEWIQVREAMILDYLDLIDLNEIEWRKDESK